MKRLLVFTDLDGTLLDHHDYSWQKAIPALAALEQQNYPVIINSSKTSTEIIKLRQLLANHHPFVSENGSVANIPVGYFSAENELEKNNSSYKIHIFGKAYRDIVDTLESIRAKYNYRFNGFNDISTNELALLCNFSEQQAFDAKQREATEPLIWLDTKEAFLRFQSLLAEEDLIVIKGGRFYHVMADVDKGQTLLWLKKQYQTFQPETEFITIGLGDSFNDVQMLEVVDYPVLISNTEINQPDLSYLPNITVTNSPGPEGWGEAVLAILENNK